jgi:hypothetical protein
MSRFPVVSFFSICSLFVVVFTQAGCSAEWYSNPCVNGDPVQIECLDDADILWEDPSTDLCSELAVTDGSSCAELDAQCVQTQAFTCASMDPNMRSSEALMTCLTEPPEADLCPTSSRSVKRNIHYVAGSERQVLAKEVLDVKLARYHYRDAKKPGLKLGYILEDHPSASFSGDGRVDLYAYMSAVVALAQEQQAEIEELKAEVSALKTTR